MAMTVTATQGGATANGMLLRVMVLTGTAATQNGATASATGTCTVSITTTVTGSRVYGGFTNGTGVGAVSGTTLIDNFNDSTNAEVYGSFKTTSATGTPGSTSVGATNGDVFGDVAAVEILPSGTVTENGSAPAVVTTMSATTLTTASFTPPPGSLLLALIGTDGAANGSTLTTMAVSDTSGLSWTETAHGASSTSCYAGVWMARVPGSAADQPQIQPGLTWLDTFKPGLRRPRPFTSAPASAPTESGPLAVPLPVPLLSLNGLDTLLLDQPGINPGATWLDLYKPGLVKPRPLTLPAYAPANEQGTFSIALPVPATVLSGLDTLPLDQPQAQPGPVWLDLFKSGLRRQRPVPPAFAPAAEQGSFSITLPLPSLSLTGLDTLPSDQLQAQPGSTWLDLFKPWVPRPRPQPPAYAPANEQGAFNVTLPLPALALGGLDTLTTDQPGINPGATWLGTFKAGLRRPRPVTAQTYAVGGEQGTLGIVLPVPSAAVSGLDTLTTDQPQAQPGPAWLAWLKPGLRKPGPPLPAQPPPGTSTEAGAFLVVLPPGQRDQNETGDFTQLLPVPALSLAGAVAHDGSLAVSLPVPSTSLSAATNSGPFAAALPSPVLSLTGVKGHAGGLAVPLPVPVLPLTGHAKMTWTGALAVTLPVPQAALTGADGHAGFLNISFAVPPPHMTWHEFLASGLAPRSVQLSRFEMFGAQSLAEAAVTLPLPVLSLAAHVPDPPGWRTVFRAGRWISARVPRDTAS